MRKISFLLAIILLLSSFLMTACNKDKKPEETTPEETTPPVENPPVVHASISVEQLKNYEIVSAKSSSEEVDKITRALQETMQSIYQIPVSLKTENAYNEKQYEILIGNTNREESATFLAKYDIKWNDYGYGIIGDKLVIIGGNEDGTLEALRAFLKYLENNANGEIFFSNANRYIVADRSYPFPNLTINGIAAEDLSILCNEEELGGVAQILRDAIIDACGIAVPIVTDKDIDRIENKIVIGHTNQIIIDPAPEDSAYPTGKEFYISMLAGSIFIDANTAAGYLSAATYVSAQLAGEGGANVVLEQKQYMGEDAIGVMSFNLMAGKESNRLDSVVETILKYRPAVVGVQEATDTWIALLNQRLGDIYTIVGDGRNATRGDEHSAILYLTAEFDCLESGTKWLSDTPDVPGSQFAESHYTRIMTYVHLSRKSDGKEFLHVNTHLDYGSTPEEEAVKVAQMQVLFEQIEKFSGIPTIITGDFNATVDSPVYQMITGAGYLESAGHISPADRAPTYHGLMGTTGTPSHIDFIFYKGMANDIYYRICTERVDNENVSDHYPIFAVLVFHEGK